MTISSIRICLDGNLIQNIFHKARVMRDFKNIDAAGRGKSKEYSFVTFTTHEDALKALRSINNNPNIFSKSRVIYYISTLCLWLTSLLRYIFCQVFSQRILFH